jgi:hypothetical protein
MPHKFETAKQLKKYMHIERKITAINGNKIGYFRPIITNQGVTLVTKKTTGFGGCNYTPVPPPFEVEFE